MTSKGLSAIGSAALIIALLFVTPPRHKAPDPDDRAHSHEWKTLECVIDTAEDMYSRVELRAGFNYELLKIFAGRRHRPISIRIARKGECPADSVILGKADLLVTDSPDSLFTGAGLSASAETGLGCRWVVREEDRAMFTHINLWINSVKATEEYSALLDRFSRSYSPWTRTKYGVKSKNLSPYDDIIRNYAGLLGWDWKLLVAVVYQESKFSINTFSSRGASGLMQIMPSTALSFGVTDLTDPEQNLLAGTSFLHYLQKAFPLGEFTKEERAKFTLAAYNAGEGRISDCRQMTRAAGGDDTKWSEVVKVIPEMGEYKIMGPDSTVVRSGRFRGGETINYVNSVLELYHLFCEIYQ